MKLDQRFSRWRHVRPLKHRCHVIIIVVVVATWRTHVAAKWTEEHRWRHAVAVVYHQVVESAAFRRLHIQRLDSAARAGQNQDSFKRLVELKTYSFCALCCSFYGNYYQRRHFAKLNNICQHLARNHVTTCFMYVILILTQPIWSIGDCICCTDERTLTWSAALSLDQGQSASDSEH